jgi:hypothetical protein
MARSGERGIALVGAMLMVVLLSAIGASLMAVARVETLSSLNYKTMSQARYAAESGVHSAAHHLMYAYEAPTVSDLVNYDRTGTPVKYSGGPVVLSTDPDVASNYPDLAAKNAFEDAAQGLLDMQEGSISYAARATLISMRTITDAYAGTAILQTWEITGIGTIPGAGSANVEVSAVIERQVAPAYRFAAFATSNGCGALSFAGGAVTDSYNSTELSGGPPVFSDMDGNVGTNGNLSEVGSGTQIGGSLSTPRAGVGACTSNNVTAATISGNATVEGGLVQLPQPITFPTPDAPTPLPPTTNNPLGVAECSAIDASPAACSSSGSVVTITPAANVNVVLGNVRLTAGGQLILNAGTYLVNSLTLAGNSSIVINSGPVVFQVAGVGETAPIDLTGGSVTNSSLVPSDLQFVYAGTGQVRLRGGAANAAVVYAPNAETSLAGGSDFYGAIITGRLTATGGTAVHYDRNLMQSDLVTAGNFTMNTFTWNTF